MNYFVRCTTQTDNPFEERTKMYYVSADTPKEAVEICATRWSSDYKDTVKRLSARRLAFWTVSFDVFVGDSLANAVKSITLNPWRRPTKKRRIARRDITDITA